MSPRNDDLSLKLAKANNAGFFPNIPDTELDGLQEDARELFSDDPYFSANVYEDSLVFNFVKNGSGVGDGSTSTGAGTNNDAAIIAAIETAKTFGLKLYFPPGIYKTMIMHDIRGIHTIGAGMGKTIIMSGNTTDAVFLVGGGAFYMADMTVQHFARPNAITVPNGVGIRIQKLQDRSVIERIHILNVTSGFYSYEPYNDTTNYCFSSSIRDCRVDRFSHSIMYIRGYSAGNTGCVISNIYGQNGNGDGTYNEAPYGFFFSDFNEGVFQQLNIEWGFYAVGITIAECTNVGFNAIHFEQYRAKGASFSAHFNIYGSNTHTVRLSGVNFKDCIYDQANVTDYAIARIQAGLRLFIDGLSSTGATVIGTVTRRKYIFENDSARVIARGIRMPDASFQGANYYSVAPAAPHDIIASGPLGTGDLYEESGALKYRGSSGTITTLGVA